jgi:CNT family concentrative nucleoside transporter
MNYLRWVSLLGMMVFLALAWACSSDKKRFPWWTVVSGTALQFVFALLILRTRFGRQFFELAQLAVNKLQEVANDGARLVFGPLADQEFLSGAWGPEHAVVFAIFISATIIVVAALSSLLYHWGILQRVVQAMAWVMTRVMRTTGSESLAAAANIFMGQTEAPLLIKPYLVGMTRSELLAMMTSGMATIAGGVAVIYAKLGASAGHLLSASVMSAPAALLVAKIMIPETERSQTGVHARPTFERNATNSVDALCRGAGDGLMLSLNVLAMLIAFVAMVSLANALLRWPQTQFGVTDPVTLERIFGFVNAPFAWLMGVPWADCRAIGQVLGERIVLNEFIGYQSLTAMDKAGQLSDPRSFVLATYALCGFANFGSIAIQIGGIGVLVPSRRDDLARLGLRAMIGGLLASYMTATVVGVLM